jgi:WD40 repeat protein
MLCNSPCLFFLIDGVGHQDYVGSVAAWRGHHPIVVSGSSDGTIKAWDTQTGTLITTGEGHMRDVWAVAVSHGPSPLIVSGSFDRTVRVWNINPILAEMNWQRRKHFCVAIHRILRGETSVSAIGINHVTLDLICMQLLFLIEGDDERVESCSIASVSNTVTLCPTCVLFISSRNKKKIDRVLALNN